MELLRLHFPGVHHALREALDSLSTFASYFLGDTVPSAEERGENSSRRDGGRGEELGEMTAEGNQQDKESKEALEEEVINSRDLEDTFSSRGSELREAWEKEKEKKAREIQESEAEGVWEIGKEVGVCLNEEMTKNSKEAKGEIRGNYKVEVQGAWCMMGIEPKQGQKTDAVEARECKKGGILVEGYLETGFASEEKGGKELKAQDKKNQEPSKEKVNVGKAENYEETKPVGEQKEEVKEIKPRDLEERARIALGVESENRIICEKEKENKQTPETEGNVRDWQEAKGEKAQRMKIGEPGNGQKIEIETRSCDAKTAPDGTLGGGLGKDGKVETSEKLESEKHEVKGTWEAERSETRCAKKEMEKEVAWEVQGIKSVDIDIKKLKGAQEPGEKTERKDSVKSEVWMTSVMEKVEAREAVKSKTAETSSKKEAEEAWKAEDMEISREWNMEVIQRGWDTEEATEKDLKKDKERGTKENPWPEQVQTQKAGREEEMEDFWVLEKKETVKILESGILEVGEGSWGLEGEAAESCENQSEKNVGQDIQETTIWEGILDNVSKNKEIGSVKAKEVIGGWEIKPGRLQDIEEIERIEDSDETWVTRPEKEAEGAKLMREAKVRKRQESETKDKVRYRTREVKEDQNPEKISGNWNMEAEARRAQETEKKSREVQDLKEEEAKGREEEPFIIPESETLEGCEMEAYSAQNIKNIENGNVQDVKKQDLVVVEDWKITEREVESGQVTEIEDRGCCEGKEEVFTPQTREDKGNWETKGSQEFKQQEVSKAEVKTGWGTKETGTTEPEMEEKEVRGVWGLKGGQEAPGDKGYKMEESEVRKLQEREAMEAKEYWEAEGEVIRNQEIKVEGSQEREDERSRTLDLETGRTWEREEKESEGETDSADAEESWIAEKEEADSNCEKEKSAFCQGTEIQMVMTNKEMELVIEEEMKEGQIKSEEEPEEGKENRETGKGIYGHQGVNSENTWPLEEETPYEDDTQAEATVGESHPLEGKSSMDNQYMEKVEAKEGRRLEAEKMEGSDNVEEADGQGQGNREELEPIRCSDTNKAAGWEDEDKDSETFGVWESSEKSERVWDLEKADPGQGRRTEEAADTGSGGPEALENRETEAPAPTNSTALRLSPAPSPADETQSSWSEIPIPGPFLDLSIPRSRVLLSRNASQRRSRPSFRRAKKGDSGDDDESLSFLPNEEEAPASKLRLLQSDETAVPSPPKPEETPVIARKRPLGHGFGFAHPSMMQELQTRLGRPKPQ